MLSYSLPSYLEAGHYEHTILSVRKVAGRHGNQLMFSYFFTHFSGLENCTDFVFFAYETLNRLEAVILEKLKNWLLVFCHLIMTMTCGPWKALIFALISDLDLRSIFILF